MEAVQNSSPYQNTTQPDEAQGPQPSHYEQVNGNGASAQTRRQAAERMSRNQEVNSSQTTRELRGLSVLDSIFNFGKKIGRAACLLGGFGCSTAAVLSMFFLNIKLLGMMFAVPAALFFFTATNLAKSTKKEEDTALVTEPVKALNDVLEHKVHYLRENPNHVFKIIQAIEDMPKHHPDYSAAMDRLAALREAVVVERAQLLNLDDEQSLMYLGQMDDYLNIINNILPEVQQAEVLEPDQVPEGLKEV
ncbi:MAG: hypothetical protein OXU45_06980 [Candidatus Melainabacteria bacterium]|nr:hypothetical protein [Candidatus Melainabacteria bacterium]